MKRLSLLLVMVVMLTGCATAGHQIDSSLMSGNQHGDEPIFIIPLIILDLIFLIDYEDIEGLLFDAYEYVTDDCITQETGDINPASPMNDHPDQGYWYHGDEDAMSYTEEEQHE